MTKALALTIVLLLAALGWQWGRAEYAGHQAEKVRSEFASYREAAERQAREQRDREAERVAEISRQRQEAIDAHHKDRLALQAAADRLRGSNGQLQRYVTDLSTSLADRARSDPTAGSCAPAVAALDLSAQLLGGVDDAAAEIAVYADQVRLAHQLCVSTFNAVRRPP